MPWTDAPSSRSARRSKGCEVQRSCCQARPIVARPGLCGRPDGATGALHRCGAGPGCRPLHAPPLCRAGRKGTPPHIQRTKAALAAKKAAGARLGNPRNLTYAGQVGRAALIDVADEFAADLTPLLETIRANGAITLASMAMELDRRGIKPARGGKWQRSSVRNLLERTKLLA
jgi:hypothetical protein